MKTIKIMSIIGVSLGTLSLICLMAWNTPQDYQASIGWGIIATLYLIAFAIVGIVKSKKNKNK